MSFRTTLDDQMRRIGCGVHPPFSLYALRRLDVKILTLSVWRISAILNRILRNTAVCVFEKFYNHLTPRHGREIDVASRV